VPAGTLLKPADVAETLRIARSFVYRKIESGELHAHKLRAGPNARLRVEQAEVDRFLNQKENG
jgi:excisionase family DNA binding protein